MKGFVIFLLVCVALLVLYAIFTGLPADVVSPFRPPNP